MNRALLIFVSILFLGSLSTNAQIQPTSLKNKIVEPFVIYEIWTGESKWDWNSKYLYHTSLAKVVIEKDTVWIDRYNEIFDAENLYLFKLDLTPGVEAVMPDDPKYIKQKKEREEKKRREQAFIDSIFIKNNIPDDFEMIYKVDGNLPYLWGRKNSKAGIIDLQGNEVIPFEYDQATIYYEGEKHQFRVFTMSFEKETETLTLAWWNSNFKKIIEYTRSAHIYSPYGGVTLSLTDDGSLCRIILTNGKNKIANIKTLEYINDFEYDKIDERYIDGYLNVERNGKRLRLDEFGNEYK